MASKAKPKGAEGASGGGSSRKSGGRRWLWWVLVPAVAYWLLDAAMERLDLPRLQDCALQQ
eukprot:8227968-Alexandrium_andersonii.AAC.1